MGTEKRERQKANKARREQEAAREKAKSRTIRLSLLIGGAIVAVFVIVAVAGRFFVDSDDDPVVPDDVVVPTEVAPAQTDPVDSVDPVGDSVVDSVVDAPADTVAEGEG
ncbi:MAG: hypothetical protein ABJH68_21270 [Ilumatobacter sp.]|uniref:hypothetical protein n=1 Tax=Ilumatobacter sp. TaxID=1967498 RepID=UPI0032983CF4